MIENKAKTGIDASTRKISSLEEIPVIETSGRFGPGRVYLGSYDFSDLECQKELLLRTLEHEGAGDDELVFAGYSQLVLLKQEGTVKDETLNLDIEQGLKLYYLDSRKYLSSVF